MQPDLNTWKCHASSGGRTGFGTQQVHVKTLTSTFNHQGAAREADTELAHMIARLEDADTDNYLGPSTTVNQPLDLYASITVRVLATSASNSIKCKREFANRPIPP